MTIGIKLENMQQAERFSFLCNRYPYEMALRAKKFCADPKSNLGVLAMMYSGKDELLLDTGDMPDEKIGLFTEDIAAFIRPEAE